MGWNRFMNVRNPGLGNKSYQELAVGMWEEKVREFFRFLFSPFSLQAPPMLGVGHVIDPICLSLGRVPFWVIFPCCGQMWKSLCSQGWLDILLACCAWQVLSPYLLTVWMGHWEVLRVYEALLLEGTVGLFHRPSIDWIEESRKLQWAFGVTFCTQELFTKGTWDLEIGVWNLSNWLLFVSLRELQRGRETENQYPCPHQQANSTVQGGSSNYYLYYMFGIHYTVSCGWWYICTYFPS